MYPTEVEEEEEEGRPKSYSGSGCCCWSKDATKKREKRAHGTSTSNTSLTYDIFTRRRRSGSMYRRLYISRNPSEFKLQMDDRIDPSYWNQSMIEEEEEEDDARI